MCDRLVSRLLPANTQLLAPYWLLLAVFRSGLCDTYYIAHVKQACAFLGDGECATAQLQQHDNRGGSGCP